MYGGSAILLNPTHGRSGGGGGGGGFDMEGGGGGLNRKIVCSSETSSFKGKNFLVSEPDIYSGFSPALQLQCIL